MTSPYARSIGVVFIAGCSLALHAGKMPAALPLIKAELDLTLSTAGVIVGMHAALSACCALLCGLVVAKLGYARFAIAGVALSGVGSLIGSHSPSLWPLMISRVIEGAGWILAVVSLPALMNSLSREKDRALVMGIWGAFVPVGAGLMLLVSPLLLSIGGWRLSWMLAGGVSLLSAALLFWVCHANKQNLSSLSVLPTETPFVELRRPSVWWLAALFLLYSVQFGSVTVFLPTMLVDLTTVPLSAASYWVALIMLINGIGNLLGGWLVGLGVARGQLIIVVCIVGGILSCLVYAPVEYAAIRIGSALLFSLVTGIIPGTVFATIPVIASSAVSVGLIVAVVLQGIGIGQLIGPVAISAVVDGSNGNWAMGSLFILVTGVAMVATAVGLNSRLRRQIQ
ncbi:MAG: MFS transporter [Gammaproteobacteria bacterium]|nr:MFS transporter [Gammaproteobacteria bacterium]